MGKTIFLKTSQNKCNYIKSNKTRKILVTVLLDIYVVLLKYTSTSTTENDDHHPCYIAVYFYDPTQIFKNAYIYLAL